MKDVKSIKLSPMENVLLGNKLGKTKSITFTNFFVPDEVFVKTKL